MAVSNKNFDTTSIFKLEEERMLEFEKTPWAQQVDTPFISNLQISEIRECIEGRSDFIEIKEANYSVFVYLLVKGDSFPAPPLPLNLTDRQAKIRRELRGLVVSHDNQSTILARRFHKFFNLDEKPETSIDSLLDILTKHPDQSDFVITEKLDGSMISPYIAPNSTKIIWATKKGKTGLTPIVEQFVCKRENQVLEQFARDSLQRGWSPIFEWCSVDTPILVPFAKDSLVLICLRHSATGYYMSYKSTEKIAQEYGIQVVPLNIAHEAETGEAKFDPREFLKQVRSKKDFEGYVFKFEKLQRLYKIKTEWYSSWSKDKNMLLHARSSEKFFLKCLVEESFDDLIPFIPQDIREQYVNFSQQFSNQVLNTAMDLQSQFNTWKMAHPTASRKEFAADFQKHIKDKSTARVFWAIFDDRSPLSEILQIIKMNLNTSSQLDSVRHLFGNLRWTAPETKQKLDDDE